MAAHVLVVDRPAPIVLDSEVSSDLTYRDAAGAVSSHGYIPRYASNRYPSGPILDPGAAHDLMDRDAARSIPYIHVALDTADINIA